MLLVGFLSFRSTLKFLENEKIASIREVQTLKIEKSFSQKTQLIINPSQKTAHIALLTSSGRWAQGIVSSEALLAPVRALNQGPIRALVFDLSPLIQGAAASKHILYSTLAPKESQFQLAKELLENLPANIRKVSLPTSGDHELSNDTALMSWSSVPLPHLARPLQILSFASRNDVYAAFKRFLLEQAFLIFLLLGASIFVALKFSNYLSRPLETLVNATRTLQSGDFNIHVDIKRRDEIGALAEAFNKMSEGLRQRDEALQSAQSSLMRIEMKTEVMKKLSEFTGQLAKSLNFDELKVIAARGVSDAFSTQQHAALYFRFDSENKCFIPDAFVPTVEFDPKVQHLPMTHMLGFDLEKSMETGILEMNKSSFSPFERFLKLIPTELSKDFEKWKCIIVRSNKSRPHGLLLFQTESWNQDSYALLNRYQFVIESTFDNATIHEEIKEISMRDGLTGLFNVRHFKQLFLEEIRRAQTQGSHFSFLFFDVDHFKKFNDTHGHPAGDRVLKQVAALMREFFSEKTDVIARYGGEEFVVLIKDTVGQDAFQRAEVFRSAIERDHFEGEETQPLGKLTISIGVSAYPTHGRNISDVIQAADDALYEAKKMSRNTVVWAKELSAPAKPKHPQVPVPKLKKAS